ncbi:MAG TPA: S53 family peptidase [Trebonia sp.]
MTFSVRSRLWTGLAVGVLAIAATAGAAQAAPAAASTPGPNTPVKVPTGILASSLRGATPFGNTPAKTPERVSFILRERHLSQLESAVTGGLSGFDSVSDFTARYGQASDVVSQLTSYLSSFGITATADPGNVDVSASGTAGEFDAALSVKTKDYHVPAQHESDGYQVPAQTVYCSTGAPELPYHLARHVLAILGLTNYAPFDSHAVHVSSKVSVKPSSGAKGDQPTDYLPSDFAARYGLSPLYKQANGAGETLGIVTLAAVDPGAPQHFWKNVAKVPSTGRTVTVDNVDGGPGKPSDAAGTGETDLDVEQAGGLAPGANVIVYQAPNSDPGFIDGFFAAASQDTADTVSTSWGESETFVAAAVAAGQETAAYQAAFDEAFLELADQGQSVFVASGDYGAYGAFADLGTTNLSVGSPDDSPFVTSAGGTTTPWSGPVKGAKRTVKVTVRGERAWGWDYLWKPIATTTGTSYADAAKANIAGGGGGFSVDEPAPSYQSLVSGTSGYHAVRYLTPTGFQSVVAGVNFVEPTDWKVTAKPPLISGSGSGRAEPDLAANADPYTGYLLYEPSGVAAGNPALQPGWGGTSFVAPQFNGATAVIDSYLGHRIGLWNPSLYQFAAGSASPVTPLSKAGAGNDNLFYTGTPGELYNPASGLGVPNMAAYAADLAAGSDW